MWSGDPVWTLRPYISRIPPYPSELEVYARAGLIVPYGLKTRNRFLLVKNEVTNAIYICSFSLGSFSFLYPKLSKSFDLEATKI